MKQIKSGITDNPALREDDLLGLQQYADSLAHFILFCETPITIGIQGDWGAGKTSLMEMVRENLEDRSQAAGYKVHCIWFNTWMYSQFNAGDRLPLLMLTAFIRRLPTEGRGHEKALSYLGTLGKIAVGLAAKQLAGVEIEFDGEVGMTGDVLEELRSKFVEIIAAYCSQDDRSRVIFFVDDLDRLLPERAVELMEVIKLFLDSPNVLFVLACDYPVVAKGIRAKFNLDVAGSYEERSFFDKIIQVPFRMPMHDYNLDAYVAALLEKIGWSVGHDAIDDFRQLLEKSIGFNPRTIKRLFNTTLLLTTLLNAKDPEILTKDHRRVLLFAVQCMEMKYPTLHQFLARHPDQVSQLYNEESLEELTKEPDLQYESKLQSLPNFPAFAALFYRLVDRDGSRDISPEEVQEMSMIFGMSRITSVEEEIETPVRMTQDWKEEQFYANLANVAIPGLMENIQRLCHRPFNRAGGKYYKSRELFYFEMSFLPPRLRSHLRVFWFYSTGDVDIHYGTLFQDGRSWPLKMAERIRIWIQDEFSEDMLSQGPIISIPADHIAVHWDSFEALVVELAEFKSFN